MSDFAENLIRIPCNGKTAGDILIMSFTAVIKAGRSLKARPNLNENLINHGIDRNNSINLKNLIYLLVVENSDITVNFAMIPWASQAESIRNIVTNWREH